MPDPFEVLESPVVPIDPEPTFGRRLRSQIQRALALPEGVTMTDPSDDHLFDPVRSVNPAAANRGARVVPYLAVSDARRAIEWYEEALGARPRGEPIVMPDGRVGHAELEVAGGLVFLADESPESRVAAPRPGADAPVSLAAAVDDVDGTVQRATARGAVVERAPADHPHGRTAVIRDPFGHRWILSGVPATAARPPGGRPGIREGDVGYASLWLRDAERGAAFYSRVLGWAFAPPGPGGARRVEGTSLDHGLAGGRGPTLFVCYAVDDVEAAIERVRAAGGRADEPTEEPYGRVAMCADPESMAFALYQPPRGPREPRPAPNGVHHGDLAYLTMEAVDSSVARRFYGEVLGWHFVPGRVEDGWGAEGVVPMTGMRGGHDSPAVVPLYRVDDLGGAVDRVRAAGGTASSPLRQPYGLTSECVDDQGTRFSLGQLEGPGHPT